MRAAVFFITCTNLPNEAATTDPVGLQSTPVAWSACWKRGKGVSSGARREKDQKFLVVLSRCWKTSRCLSCPLGANDLRSAAISPKRSRKNLPVKSSTSFVVACGGLLPHFAYPLLNVRSFEATPTNRAHFGIRPIPSCPRGTQQLGEITR